MFSLPFILYYIIYYIILYYIILYYIILYYIILYYIILYYIIYYIISLAPACFGLRAIFRDLELVVLKTKTHKTVSQCFRI